MIFSEFLNVSIATATVVTAVAAVIGVWKYRSDVKALKVLRWQKTTVQAILQQSSNAVTFEELKLQYRSFAVDHMRDKLGNSDISEEALRMILVELCAGNVVVQLGGDTYCLATYLGQMRDIHSLQTTFFNAQLEFLSKQDANIKEMVDQQRRMTDTIAPVGANTNFMRGEN